MPRAHRAPLPGPCSTAGLLRPKARPLGLQAVVFSLALTTLLCTAAGHSEAAKGRRDVLASRPQVISEEEQALWWACYAARHDLLPSTTLMSKVNRILTDRQELAAFIGLCYGT